MHLSNRALLLFAKLPEWNLYVNCHVNGHSIIKSFVKSSIESSIESFTVSFNESWISSIMQPFKEPHGSTMFRFHVWIMMSRIESRNKSCGDSYDKPYEIPLVQLSNGRLFSSHFISLSDMFFGLLISRLIFRPIIRSVDIDPNLTL